MKIEKLMGTTFTLLSIVSILAGVAIIYVANALAQALPTLQLLGTPTGALTTGITLMWVFGFLNLALGFSSLVSAIVLLVKKEKR